jgi:hypothetical protein
MISKAFSYFQLFLRHFWRIFIFQKFAKITFSREFSIAPTTGTSLAIGDHEALEIAGANAQGAYGRNVSVSCTRVRKI